MGAVIVGVWSIIFLAGMVGGMMESYIDNAIRNEVSHIQIHHPEFIKDKKSEYYIEDANLLLEKVNQTEGIQSASVRTITNAMVASGRGNRGIRVSGIDPEQEKQVSYISQKLVEGTWFDSKGKNPIVLSKKTADKLKVKLRSKIILTFQDLEGNITSGAFRVTGIFQSGNNMYDGTILFVKRNDLNKLMGKEDVAHEVAIILDDVMTVDTVKNELQEAFPDLLVQTYTEISPELELFQSQIQSIAVVYMVIFMLALVFGIINTMLMAVLERVRELGVLMSVGMNKVRVFFMIVLETLLLGIIAAPVGILLGWLTSLRFSKTGINLAIFSEEGMAEFGMSTFIYPKVDPSIYGQLAIAVLITALVGSIYPAIKAIRLKPMEAIRKL
jgi:ABC-type lipoprotein release transport system permease subunit